MAFINSLKGFDQNALRRQTTRITTRSGAIFEEKRLDDGSFTDPEFIAQGPPLQFAEDASKGFSALKFHVFDNALDTWVEVSAPTPPLDQTPNPNPDPNPNPNPTLDETPTPTPTPTHGQESIKIVTYNVWFADDNWFNRAQALFTVVRNRDPDIICLQEVTPRFLQLMLEQDWIRRNYFTSDKNGSTVIPYGVVMLSKLPFIHLRLYSMPTNMGRRFLYSEIAVNGLVLCVGTVHMESLDNADMREAQLSFILAAVNPNANFVVLGDFNFHAGMTENRLIQQVDSWAQVHGNDSELAMTRRGHMIDRVIHSSTAFHPVSIGRIGYEPIVRVDLASELTSEDARYPSDHDGVEAVFEFI